VSPDHPDDSSRSGTGSPCRAEPQKEIPRLPWSHVAAMILAAFQVLLPPLLILGAVVGGVLLLILAFLR
jgi:hypothetical protein